MGFVRYTAAIGHMLMHRWRSLKSTRYLSVGEPGRRQPYGCSQARSRARSGRRPNGGPVCGCAWDPRLLALTPSRGKC